MMIPLIGVDSKKGDSSPAMQFFYTFSKVKKISKIFYFLLLTRLTYVGYTILTNVRGDYYGKEKVAGDEPCGNRNSKISLAA